MVVTGVLFEALARSMGAIDLQKKAKDLLHEFWPEITTVDGKSLPIPRIKIVDRLTVNWLGLCVFKFSKPHNTEILIQKGILGDEPTVDRILAHEMCHHVDFMSNMASRKKGVGHGASFFELAGKINSKRGAGYVSESSDSHVLTEQVRDYFLLIVMLPDGRYGYSVAFKLTETQKAKIKRRMESTERNARMIKTNDRYWIENGPTLSSSKIYLPAEKQEDLKKLYETEFNWGTVLSDLHLSVGSSGRASLSLRNMPVVSEAMVQF